MKVYIKFLTTNFFKSFLYVFFIMLCLVFILNLLSEVEFFRNMEVDTYFTIYVSFLNSPALIFEMFPFIFLLTTQLFFINLFNNNEIDIFKYSGLKNTSVLKIISIISLLLGVLLITLFYNFSSNLKNVYLELKTKYTNDGKYLAVITKNGLWMKDIVGDKISLINASKIDQNYLIDTFITQFNKDYEAVRNIKSEKIDIKNKEWIIYNAKIFENDQSFFSEKLNINSNFDYKRVQSLFSNLSSLSILELIELKKNYKSLNYSTTEVDIQIQKLISYPLYLVLMTIFSSIIMFNSKKFKSSTFKITLGLFFSVIIYYVNNFFNVLGTTEKISIIISVWAPLILLMSVNIYMFIGINEK